MKKVLTAIMSLVLLAGAAMPTWAQTRRGERVERAPQYRVYDNSRRVYYDRRYDDRSFFEQHRDKVTVAGGAVAGAVLGALVGGGKGAAIGALVGGGGSALYTYKLRDRDDAWRYRR
jgi:Glycine zipper